MHFRFDADDGAEAGAALSHYAAAEMLRPFKRADVNHDGRVDESDRRTFAGWYAAERAR